MIKGIYYTGRSLETRVKNIDTIANNIANLNTVGFKRQVPFIEVLNSSGSVSIKQITDFTQGEIILTSNPLDAAISGDGYFTLQAENGIELTRNGKFKLNSEGFLVNEQGYKVLGQNGEINISDFQLNDQQKITISKEGILKIGENEIDTLQISKIAAGSNPTRTSGLNFLGDGDITKADKKDYEIAQGYLEESNVNPVIEMEAMIQKNTDYESAYKVMKFLDESLKNANEIGKV